MTTVESLQALQTRKDAEENVEFPEIWTTRDGRKLRVSDMDEHHVRAALNMVLRRTRNRLAKLRLQLHLKEVMSMAEKHDINLFDDDNWGDS